MLDLRVLLESQGWTLERESKTAFFYNFAPWIAPKAYLHIVFKGADPSALEHLGETLQIPQNWLDHLAIQNGAILYSGALATYGVHTPGALLNRTDVFNRLPFSLVNENRSWPAKPTERYVVIGSYQHDGTRAVLDREDGSILAMPRKTNTAQALWPSAESWLKGELTRMASLFDAQGRIQVPEERTLPSCTSSS
jgi:hypothetical protein